MNRHFFDPILLSNGVSSVYRPIRYLQFAMRLGDLSGRIVQNQGCYPLANKGELPSRESCHF
jgi:hypothetical protein